MRDALPTKSWRYESAIVNLNKATQRGTHWVCNDPFRRVNATRLTRPVTALTYQWSTVFIAVNMFFLAVTVFFCTSSYVRVFLFYSFRDSRIF